MLRLQAAERRKRKRMLDSSVECEVIFEDKKSSSKVAINNLLSLNETIDLEEDLILHIATDDEFCNIPSTSVAPNDKDIEVVYETLVSYSNKNQIYEPLLPTPERDQAERIPLLPTPTIAFQTNQSTRSATNTVTHILNNSQSIACTSRSNLIANTCISSVPPPVKSIPSLESFQKKTITQESSDLEKAFKRLELLFPREPGDPLKLEKSTLVNRAVDLLESYLKVVVPPTQPSKIGYSVCTKPTEPLDNSDILHIGQTWIPRETADKAIHVYIDGSLKDGIGGCGVYFGDDHPLNVSEKFIAKKGKLTSTDTEIYAATRALQQVKKMNNKRNVFIYTDCSSILEGLSILHGKPAKAIGPKLKKLKKDFEDLEEARKGLAVRWIKVKGHSGLQGNLMADKLAKEGRTDHTERQPAKKPVGS